MPSIESMEMETRANSFLGHLARSAEKPGDLADEVFALRQEIAALRAELAPVPGLILTGREVLEQFKRLKTTQGEHQ